MEPGSVTFMSGLVSLLSGWYITSEMGSIISLAANLYALEDQVPSVVNDWIKGNFIMLVQSDDVLFTLPKKIDSEPFAARIESLGMKSKLQEGAMFLKQLLPLGYLAFNKLKSAKPIVRLVTNTWGNEQNYSAMPDAVIRLGLFGRAQNVLNNPIWKHMRPSFDAMLETSDIYNDSHTLSNYDKGIEYLSEEDVNTIREYSEGSGLGWLSKLMNRADADPYAATTLRLLGELGISTEALTDELLKQRQMYLTTLFKKVNSDAFHAFETSKQRG
jgi:hypothetical protein